MSVDCCLWCFVVLPRIGFDENVVCWVVIV